MKKLNKINAEAGEPIIVDNDGFEWTTAYASANVTWQTFDTSWIVIPTNIKDKRVIKELKTLANVNANRETRRTLENLKRQKRGGGLYAKVKQGERKERGY